MKKHCVASGKKSKEYNKQVNLHIRQQKNEFIRKLKEAKSTNPKVYWNMLNTKKHADVKANMTDLYNHFKSLSQGDSTQTNSIPETHTPDTSEEIPDSSSLNAQITVDEINKAIASLENGKSSGIDKIINEYIKNSRNKLMPVYTYFLTKYWMMAHCPRTGQLD